MAFLPNSQKRSKVGSLERFGMLVGAWHLILINGYRGEVNTSFALVTIGSFTFSTLRGMKSLWSRWDIDPGFTIFSPHK